MILRALARYGGNEVKTIGDSFLALFDGPTSAIGSADAIRGGAVGLGCEVRSGIHTGEVEVMGDDIGGMGVHIARRITDSAGPGEIWVSPTVPGLVVGSDIHFSDEGVHRLKGVPGDWSLFSVSSL